MTTFKYFDDSTGEAIEVAFPQPMKNAEFAARFPGVRGRRYDGFSMMVGKVNGQLRPITRSIQYKSRPSLHVCNGKCLNGKVNGACECSCGGKNHGRGMFTSLMQAA